MSSHEKNLAKPLIEALPTYSELIRVGYQNTRGVTFITTLPIGQDIADKKIIQKIVDRWSTKGLRKALYWCFLFREQALGITAIEMDPIIDLEIQHSLVPVNVISTTHICTLQIALKSLALRIGRKGVGMPNQLLTSGRAFNPDCTPLALVLIWRKSKKPLIILSTILAALSVALGLAVGMATKRFDFGIAVTASLTGVFTMVIMSIVFWFGSE